jgi:hypothetical protein
MSEPLDVFTTNQVASLLNITPQMVRRVAKRLQVGRQLGHDILFTSDDIRKLQDRNTQRGRPRKATE